MDNYISADKTLRFLSVDNSLSESKYTKLYFKGNPKQCKFFNQGTTPDFSDAREDCNSHNILINRLYNRAADNDKPITKKDKPIHKSFTLPQCLSIKEPVGVKTNFLNIFNLPEGDNFNTKCIVEENLTKTNSCFIYLRKVSNAILKSLKILNSGKRFFKHGNLYAHNIYLYERGDINKIFIDNMLFDPVKYDNKENKPFKSDFNMLADMLVSLATGSEKFKLKEPRNTFHVYSQIKKYYDKNEFSINMKNFHLNMPNKFMSTKKCVSLSELEWLLRDTFFNFIYRLKCTGSNKDFRFVEIDQALKHGFLLVKKSSQEWDSLPAEF